jgi:hypothetical protein
MKGWILLRAEWDRALGILLIAVGGVGLLLGYRGVAESVFVGQQLAYVVSGGLGGLFLGAIGVGLLVSADLHDEWRKLDRIESAMRGDVVPDATDVLLETQATPSSVSDGSASERSSLRVTAFSKLSVPAGTSGPPVALTLDWDGDRLRRPLIGALGAVLAVAAVMTAGWSGSARSTNAIDGFRPVLVAGTALAVGVLAVTLYPLLLRVRLTQRKRIVLAEWLWRTKEDDIRRVHPRSDGSTISRESMVLADGSRGVHLSGCPTLKGLTTRALDADDANGALPPCRICQPS